MPFADFCDMVKVNRFTFSHESVTCRRSPEVSLTAFHAQPPDLQPVPLMDMDFAVVCPLVQHRMPQIRFLYIGSRLCSALLSGPASRRVLFHPCASLSLHVHHVVKRTFTSKRSNMLGTQTKGQAVRPALRLKAQAYDLGVSVRRRGCGFGLFPTGALDAGGLAPQAAQVVQARTTHVAFAHDVNGRD